MEEVYEIRQMLPLLRTGQRRDALERIGDLLAKVILQSEQSLYKYGYDPSLMPMEEYYFEYTMSDLRRALDGIEQGAVMNDPYEIYQHAVRALQNVYEQMGREL